MTSPAPPDPGIDLPCFGGGSYSYKELHIGRGPAFDGRTLAELHRAIAAGIYRPSVPDGAYLRFGDLGRWIVSAGHWEIDGDELRARVDWLVNGGGETTWTRGRTEYGMPLYPDGSRGHQISIFVWDPGWWYVTLRFRRDGTVEPVGLPSGDRFTPAELVAASEHGDIRTFPPTHDEIVIRGLGRFVVTPLDDTELPDDPHRDLCNLVEDALDRVGGGSGALYRLQLAHHRYLAAPSPAQRHEVRRAYQAIPLALRRYAVEAPELEDT
jgi:hypothetical protein